MMRNVETKYTGGVASTISGIVNSVFNVLPLNDIAEIGGPTTQWNTRIGQDYFLQGFKINFLVHNFIATVGDPSEPIYFRALVLEGKDLQGTSAPISGLQMWKSADDIKTSYTAISDAFACITYKVDPQYYRTLYDKTIVVGATGNGIGTKTMRTYVPVNKLITCKGAAEGDQQQNKRYFLVWFAFNPRRSGLTAKYNYSYIVQTRFKDP